jgi:chlorite dismutase
MPVEPSIGWGVTHLFYRVDRGRLDDPALAGKGLAALLSEFDRDPNQAIPFSVLGSKADFGVIAMGPDLEPLDAFRHELQSVPGLGAALVPAGSYVSLTELSEYSEEMSDEYKEHRLHPQMPRRSVIAFYPMSKTRDPENNWFLLPFEDRKRLMGGHARVGRKYAGRINQLITGSTGLDDFEWGVTLFADDPVAIKEIVYEMRFDEVSASYADFGPFFVGLVLAPAALVTRLRLV